MDLFPFKAPVRVVQSRESGFLSLATVVIMLIVLITDFEAIADADIMTDRREDTASATPPALPNLAIVVKKSTTTARDKAPFYDPQFVLIKAAHVTFSGAKKDKKKLRFDLESCTSTAGDLTEVGLCPPAEIAGSLVSQGAFEDPLFTYRYSTKKSAKNCCTFSSQDLRKRQRNRSGALRAGQVTVH